MIKQNMTNHIPPSPAFPNLKELSLFRKGYAVR